MKGANTDMWRGVSGMAASPDGSVQAKHACPRTRGLAGMAANKRVLFQNKMSLGASMHGCNGCLGVGRRRRGVWRTAAYMGGVAWRVLGA
jgi:hypothetical protein